MCSDLRVVARNSGLGPWVRTEKGARRCVSDSTVVAEQNAPRVAFLSWQICHRLMVRWMEKVQSQRYLNLNVTIRHLQVTTVLTVVSFVSGCGNVPIDVVETKNVRDEVNAVLIESTTVMKPLVRATDREVQEMDHLHQNGTEAQWVFKIDWSRPDYGWLRPGRSQRPKARWYFRDWVANRFSRWNTWPKTRLGSTARTMARRSWTSWTLQNYLEKTGKKNFWPPCRSWPITSRELEMNLAELSLLGGMMPFERSRSTTWCCPRSTWAFCWSMPWVFQRQTSRPCWPSHRVRSRWRTWRAGAENMKWSCWQRRSGLRNPDPAVPRPTLSTAWLRTTRTTTTMSCWPWRSCTGNYIQEKMGNPRLPRATSLTMERWWRSTRPRSCWTRWLFTRKDLHAELEDEEGESPC